MIALRKRLRPRSGILRGPQREWPKHRRFVARHECIVLGIKGHVCRGQIRACHWRSAANSGTGLKPHDSECWPGCDGAHEEQHRIGQPAFERKYGVDLQKIGATLTARSPDKAMRDSLSERGRG